MRVRYEKFGAIASLGMLAYFAPTASEAVAGLVCALAGGGVRLPRPYQLSFDI